MKKENPCNICKMRERDDCFGCALNVTQFLGEKCFNQECFLNTEVGCTLMFDRVCKASTEYNSELIKFEDD